VSLFRPSDGTRPRMLHGAAQGGRARKVGAPNGGGPGRARWESQSARASAFDRRKAFIATASPVVAGAVPSEAASGKPRAPVARLSTKRAPVLGVAFRTALTARGVLGVR